MTSIKRLLVLLCLSFFYSLNGQEPSITLSSFDVSSGDFRIPVRVSHFNDIVGLQFSLSWDTDFIEYLGVDSFGVDLNENINFGIENIASGLLVFSWYDATLSGISLPDSSILFNIHFQINGNKTGQTQLRFGDEPAPREIVDTSYKAIPGQFIDGTVDILMVSSQENYAQEAAINQIKIYPNPIYETGIFSFNNATDSNYFIKIIDQMGRMVYQQKNRFKAGYQQISLNRSLFPTSGLFRLVVQGEEFLITKNLLVR